MQKSVCKKTESNAKSVATSNDISNHAQLYQGGAEDRTFRTPFPIPLLLVPHKGIDGAKHACLLDRGTPSLVRSKPPGSSQ